MAEQKSFVTANQSESLGSCLHHPHPATSTTDVTATTAAATPPPPPPPPPALSPRRCHRRVLRSPETEDKRQTVVPTADSGLMVTDIYRSCQPLVGDTHWVDGWWPSHDRITESEWLTVHPVWSGLDLVWSGLDLCKTCLSVCLSCFSLRPPHLPHCRHCASSHTAADTQTDLAELYPACVWSLRGDNGS